MVDAPAPRWDEGASACLQLRGDLDVASVAKWQAIALDRLALDVPCLVIDVGEVNFIDSMGLGMLVAVRNAARAAGKEFRVVNVPDRAKALFVLTGLLGVFTGGEDS